MAEEEILRLAERQYGLVTRDQALHAGLTRRALQHRVHTARWHQPRRGVFAVSGTPPSAEQAVLAAVLAAGDTAAASHATAAALWRLPCARSDAIEITTILERQVRLSGVVAHRSGVIPDADRRTLHGIPITSGARTAIDLSGRLELDDLRRLVDEGLRVGAMSLAGLQICLSNLERFASGRSPQKVHAVLERLIPGYEIGDSRLEGRIFDWIVEAGFSPPLRLHQVDVGSRTITVDMAYPDLKIAIEIDGFDFHRGRRVFDIDRTRGNALVAHGWRLFRFTSVSTRDDVVETLRPFVRGGPA